jgi:predicted secreted protein
MLKPFGIVAALAVLAASPAVAEEPAAPKPKKERMICKRIEQIGSLASYKRICGTKEFWDREGQDARNTTARVIDGCRARAEGGNCGAF